MRIELITCSLPPISAAAFPYSPAVFFVTDKLVRRQDGTDFGLRGFFHRFDSGTRLCTKLSNLQTALFKDRVDHVALFLIQPQIIMDPGLALVRGSPVAVVLEVSSSHAGLIKIHDENSG